MANQKTREEICEENIENDCRGCPLRHICAGGI